MEASNQRRALTPMLQAMTSKSPLPFLAGTNNRQVWKKTKPGRTNRRIWKAERTASS
jgi:hypothetical protein